jgi:transcriptional regulator with XRE-family HTH domain
VSERRDSRELKPGYGARFKAAREALCLTRSDLAAASGYSAEQIRRVELESTTPGAALLAAMSERGAVIAQILIGELSPVDISKYPPSNQLKSAFEILRVLFSCGPMGITPSEIARATTLGSSYVTQQLGQLANLRAAEEVGETGRWRAGVAWSQMAVALQSSIRRDLDSLSEYGQRVTRSHQ